MSIHLKVSLMALVVAILSSSVLVSINGNPDHIFASGQTKQVSSNLKNTVNLHEIEKESSRRGNRYCI